MAEIRDGEAAVAARGLRKHYGSLLAVDGLDFIVETGECFGLLGSNGAGKSTTLRMLCGLASIEEGELRVLGHDVTHRAREAKARVGLVPQADNLDFGLSVEQILRVQAGYHGIWGAAAKERVEEALAFARLGDRRAARSEHLSGGMRRRLLIARALIGRPDLLVLDEPTSGLDPHARRDVWLALGALRARRATIVLTTHYIEEAAQLCDRVLVMGGGRKLDEGAPAELVERHEEHDLEAVFFRLTA